MGVRTPRSVAVKDWIEVLILVAAIISVVLLSRGSLLKGDQEDRNTVAVAPTNIARQLAYRELLGEKVAILDSLVGLGQPVDVLFIYGPADCGTCVQKGFDVSDHLVHNKFSGSIYYCSDGSVNGFSGRWNPFVHRLTDVRRAVSRSLRNIPTPALLLLESDRTIKSLYLPTTKYDDSFERDAFVLSVLMHGKRD